MNNTRKEDCSRRCTICRYRCRHCNLTNIGFVLSCLSIISSIVTIIYFVVQLQNLKAYDYLYEYRNSTCVPINGIATNINPSTLSITGNETYNGGEQCPAPWIMLFLLSDMRLAVTNPFALQWTRTQAIDDRSRLDLDSNYTCLCRNDKQILLRDCSVWPQCIFNAEFVKYMRRDTNRYYNTYASFIIASVVSAVLSILSIPPTIQTMRAACKQSNYVPFD